MNEQKPSFGEFLNTSKGKVVTVVIILAVVLVAGLAVFSGNKNTGGTQNVVTENKPAVLDPNQTKEQADALTRAGMDGRDASQCKKIYDETSKNYCLDAVTSAKASDTNNPSLCDSILNQTYKTACNDNIIFVQARDTKTSSLCSKLIDQARLKDCQDIAK